MANLNLKTDYSSLLANIRSDLMSKIKKKSKDLGLDDFRASLSDDIEKETPSVVPGLSSKYKFVPPGTEYNVAPDESTKLADMKFTGGQYITDPERVNELIKSVREYTPKFNAISRGGLPSYLFQVDHIIPLWAGGADTEENKEVLSKPIHEKKTRIEAVARRLYYSKVFTLNEARVMALNWKDKDDEGIELNQQGDTSLETAKAKALEWSKPIDFSIGDYVKGFGKYLTGAKPKTKKEELMISGYAEGKPGVIPQAIKGLVSGVTLGWMRAEDPNKETDDASDFARSGGQITGTIASWFLGGRVIGKIAGKIAPTKIAQATKIPQKLEALKDTKETYKLGKLVIPKNTFYKAATNAGIFTTIGQMSKQEEAGVEARAKRFLSDVTWGGVLAIPGQTLKGYAGLAMGSYAISALEGATPAEALKNTAFMVGMHGLGRIGYKKGVEAQGNAFAARYVKKWGVEPPKAENGKYTLKEMEIAQKKIIDKIEREIPVSDQKIEKAKAIITTRQLYKGGLTEVARKSADVEDLKSLFKWGKSRGAIDLDGIPGQVKTFAKPFKKHLKLVKAEPESAMPFESVAPVETVGTIRTTGVANRYNKGVVTDTATNIKSYIDNGGASGDTIFGVIRNDKAFVDGIKQKNGFLGKLGWGKYKNPEKNIEWYGFKNGETYKLGKWPRKQNITDYINKTYEKFEMKQVDPKFNKNTMYDAMTDKGYKVITATIEKIKKEAKRSKEPYVVYELRQEDWKNAAKLNNIYNKHIKSKDSIESTPKKLSEAAVNKEKAGREYYDAEAMKDKDVPLYAYLEEVKDSLSLESPRMYKARVKERLGFELTDAEALKDLTNAKDATIFTELKKVKDGKLPNKINADGKVSNQFNKDGENWYDVLLAEGSYFKRLTEEGQKKLEITYLFRDTEIQRVVRDAQGKVQQKQFPLPQEAMPLESEPITMGAIGSIKKFGADKMKSVADKIKNVISKKEVKPVEVKRDKVVETITKAKEKFVEPTAKPVVVETIAKAKEKFKPKVELKEGTVIPKELLIKPEAPKVADKPKPWELSKTFRDNKAQSKQIDSEYKKIVAEIDNMSPRKYEEPKVRLERIKSKIDENIKEINFDKREGGAFDMYKKGEIENAKKMLKSQLDTYADDFVKTIKKSDYVKDAVEYEPNPWDDKPEKWTPEKIEKFKGGFKDTENNIYTDLKKSATGDKQHNRFWQKVIDLLDNKYLKWIENVTKRKNAWRFFKIEGTQMVDRKSGKMTRSILEGMNKETLGLTPKFLDYSDKLRTGVMEGLPKELKAEYDKIKKRYPNTKILVSVKSKEEIKKTGKNKYSKVKNEYPAKYYDMHDEVRLYSRDYGIRDKLLDAGITSVFKDEIAGLKRYGETGDGKYLSNRIYDAFEEMYMLTKRPGTTKSKSGEKSIEMKTLEGDIIDMKDLPVIQSRRDFGEEAHSMISYVLHPLTTNKNLTEKQISAIAEDIIPMLGEEIKKAANLKGYNQPGKTTKKWELGGSPLLALMLSVLGITATASVPAKSQPE